MILKRRGTISDALVINPDQVRVRDSMMVNSDRGRISSRLYNDEYEITQPPGRKIIPE